MTDHFRGGTITSGGNQARYYTYHLREGTSICHYTHQLRGRDQACHYTYQSVLKGGN